MRAQIAARVGFRTRRDLLRRTYRDDLAAAASAFRPQVDDVVRRLDDVQVVLDHQNRVTRVHQPVQAVEELRDVRQMQPGRRFVEDVEHLATTLEFG